MKKLFLLMALMATAPLAFISCGDDDDDDNGNANSSSSVNLPMPTYKNYAAKFSFTEAPTVKLKGKDIILTELEFTESGNYIMTYREVNATRADKFDLSYYMNKYLMSGDSEYTLSDFGKVFLNGNSGTNYLLLIKSATGDEFEVPATKWNNIAEGTETDYLCRTWTVTNTRLMGTVKKGDKEVKLGKDFPGQCDLNKIIDYAKENGANITDKIDDNSIVQGITFTKVGTYFIHFNRSTYDVGKWQWTNKTNGTLSYTWNNPTMGNPLESGVSQVAFSNNQCKLTQKATISEFNLEVIYTLQ